MSSRPISSAVNQPAKPSSPGPFMRKIRKRGIIGALATLTGGGWLVYEIVHFILVDHYGWPERLKDIVIVSFLCAMLSHLTWRWFKGEKKTRKPKWEFILIPVFILTAAAVDFNLLLRLEADGPDPYASVLKDSGWKNSIAVLPFVNMSADKSQEYFCDGLTEEMITRLSQIRELKVTARTSAFAFKGDNSDVREIGRKLGVEKVLEGSVRKDASWVRITAQLVNVSDGFHIWSGSYDRDLDKIFNIQDEIARSVAAALKMTLLETDTTLAQTKSLEAYNEFLLGQHYYVTPNQENLEQAIGHFKRAVEIDPQYARAWAGLGAALAFRANLGFTPTEEDYPKAVAAVERALALDDRLAFGYVVRGWIQMTYDWDWAGAEASYSKALHLDPARGYFGAAQLALALGRFERALALARRAAELDSLNVSAQVNLALSAFYAGRLEEAADLFLKMVRLSPDRGNVHSLLAQVYLAQSLPELAMAVLEKEKDPFFRLPVLAMIYHSLGRDNDSYQALAKFIEDYREGGAYNIAQIFASRGDASQAFEWLEIAYKQRDGGLYLTKADPYFRALRSDPRFAAFLKKMRFPSVA